MGRVRRVPRLNRVGEMLRFETGMMIEIDGHHRCATESAAHIDRDRIAQAAIDDGSIMFNPKEATLKDARAVLEKAWG